MPSAPFLSENLKSVCRVILLFAAAGVLNACKGGVLPSIWDTGKRGLPFLGAALNAAIIKGVHLMRKPTVITVTLSLFLLAAGLADTPSAWAIKEKKVYKTLPPMPKPAYTVGYKWHYIKDGKEEGVRVVTATGNGTVSWRDSDCNWIDPDRGFAPARKWDNCKDDSSGTQRVRFKGGNIWPLKVGNKFSYSVKGRYTRGGKSWSGVRQCKVKKQVRIETVSGEYDTYKVVCEDPWGTRTWWLSPELKAAVRYKRERRNYNKPDHTWEMTKIEWPRPQVVQGKATQPVVAKRTPARTISTPGGVTLTRGTLVPVELIENINTKYNNTGELVYLSVTADVKVGDKVAIQKGALVKAKLGDIKKRGTFGRAGDLSFHPVAVAALDGQWISLAQEDFEAEGAGPSAKGILGIGIIAMGARAFVLRGTEYEVIVERDTVIDTAKSKSLASLRKADFQTTARFRRVTKKIKFARGGSERDFVLDITLTQDITSLVRQDPFAVEIVEILDYVLRKPIRPIKIVLDPKKNNFISATFSWWSIVKHAQPGYTPMTVQLKLSDGRLAQAQATLQSEWKFK